MGAEFIDNKHTHTQTVAFISTDIYVRISVTNFQFQIPLLVYFHTVVE